MSCVTIHTNVLLTTDKNTRPLPENSITDSIPGKAGETLHIMATIICVVIEHVASVYLLQIQALYVSSLSLNDNNVIEIARPCIVVVGNIALLSKT